MNENRHLRSEPRTTKVWRKNVDQAMVQLVECLKNFPLIAFDTEYPGAIHRTFMDSSDDERYGTMKLNVEKTKLIQCGFTLFNAKGEIGGTWEINFSNFGDPSDTRNEISIEFLRRHGLDLKKIRNEGVDMFGYGFFPKLLAAFASQKHVEFITFQGAYDFAYILCILNNGKLPETRGEFVSEVMRVFGEVYDLKVMAGFCEGLGEHLGLSKLAQVLDIARVGRAHHAGSDSLMTALVFIKLKQVYDDSRYAKGMLYGIGKRNLATVPARSSYSPGSLPLMCHQDLAASAAASYPLFNNGYVPSYDLPPIYYLDPSGVPYFPWMFYNGVYLNQLPSSSSTFAYQPHTQYAAADYLAPLLPSYYNNNNSCYVQD